MTQFRDAYKRQQAYPDDKVHEPNMGPTWVLSAPDGPPDDPMNLAIRVQNEGNTKGKTWCRAW